MTSIRYVLNAPTLSHTTSTLTTRVRAHAHHALRARGPQRRHARAVQRRALAAGAAVRVVADVREHADPHLTCILVGNKVDLCPEADETSDPGHDPTAASVPKDLGPASGASRKQREVPTEEAELWAQEEGLLFVEASAKTSEGVREVFEKVREGVGGVVRCTRGLVVVWGRGWGARVRGGGW